MKKSLWFMIIFSIVAVFSFPIAFAIINSQKESVVITEEVLAGDPKAAEGVTLQFQTQWDAHMLWNTTYDIGKQTAETVFTFSGDEVSWPQKESEYVQLDAVTSFGTASAVGSGNRDNGIDLEDMWLTKLLQAVAERTKPGETHREAVYLCDYYEYFPIEVSVVSRDRGVYLYNGTVQDYYSHFMHIKVPEDEKLTVSISKDTDGTIVAVDCNNETPQISFDTAYAFGKEGCLFTYVCTDWETGERVYAGENTGIFYADYGTEKHTPALIKKWCEIPDDIIPAGMCWDEQGKKLYLAAKAGKEYRLYIYMVNSNEIVLRNTLSVLEGEKLPHFRDITLEDDGILLKWDDGTFSFVTENEGSPELWCSDVFSNGEAGLAEVFGYGHVSAFDGERLILACYDGWDSVNVSLAVYDRNTQLYCGRYRHSAELDLYMSGMHQKICVQGNVTGNIYGKKSDYVPLKLLVE